VRYHPAAIVGDSVLASFPGPKDLAVLGDDEIGNQTGNRHSPGHESQEGIPRAFSMNLTGHWR